MLLLWHSPRRQHCLLSPVPLSACPGPLRISSGGNRKTSLVQWPEHYSWTHWTLFLYFNSPPRRLDPLYDRPLFSGTSVPCYRSNRRNSSPLFLYVYLPSLLPLRLLIVSFTFFVCLCYRPLWLSNLWRFSQNNWPTTPSYALTFLFTTTQFGSPLRQTSILLVLCSPRQIK